VWRNRYLDKGIEGLKKGKSRPPRIPPLSPEKVQEVLALTLSGKPVAATHWSCRTMAQQVGISRMAVHGIWRKYQLKLLISAQLFPVTAMVLPAIKSIRVHKNQ
jgi:hypothetical protein